jgi:hypothetical protein
VTSVYDELSAKIARSGERGPRDGARRDLGLILFAERDKINELWKAAELCSRLVEGADAAELRAAVDELRPLFGERPEL